MKCSILAFLLPLTAVNGFAVPAPHRTACLQSSTALYSIREKIKRDDSMVDTFDAPQGSTTKRRSPLARLITNQLLGSAMIYTFASVRAYVRETRDTLDWYRPELILTQHTAEEPAKKQRLLPRVLSAVHNRFWDEDADGVKDPLEYQNYLKYPITAAAMYEFLTNEKNEKFLMEADQVEDFNPDMMTEDSGSETNVLKTLQRFVKSDADLVEFDDQFSKSELVYSLTINRTNKRMTVCFRGSVFGGSDWPTNLSMWLTKIKTPLVVRDLGVEEEIRLHSGFNNYLNQEKFNDILGHILREYGNPNHKDYELHICGHSLGGALAALLSFRLAASGKLLHVLDGKPIKVISFASPQVGNRGYRLAYRALEENGYIQHIRISSQGDIVPVSPSLGGLYRQTGVNLHLHRAKEMEVGREPKRSILSQLGFYNPVNLHNLDEYRRRLKLDENRAILADAGTMDDMYQGYV